MTTAKAKGPKRLTCKTCRGKVCTGRCDFDSRLDEVVPYRPPHQAGSLMKIQLVHNLRAV